MNLEPLKQLLQMNSYSLNRQGVNTKLEYIQELAQDLPISWKRSEPTDKRFGDLLVGQTHKQDPNKPQVGLLLHVDTVHKPDHSFPVKEEDGKLYGPGAQDMQASIFVVLEALKDLQQQGKLYNLTIIFNTAEEQGSPEFTDEFRHLAENLDYILTYEASGNGALVETDPKFSHDFHLVTARKGAFAQTVKTKGPGGHSGMLTKKAERQNAISHAAQMLLDIENLADYEKGTLVNIQQITGGQPNTIIAENCEFSFDCRVPTEAERQRLHSSISEIVNTNYIPGVEVTSNNIQFDLPPLPPNQNSQQFFQKIEAKTKPLDITVNAERRSGWSDACNFYAFNPPISILDGLGPKGHGEHTKNEFIYLDSIQPAVQLSLVAIETALGD